MCAQNNRAQLGVPTGLPAGAWSPTYDLLCSCVAALREERLPPTADAQVQRLCFLLLLLSTFVFACVFRDLSGWVAVPDNPCLHLHCSICTSISCSAAFPSHSQRLLPGWTSSPQLSLISGTLVLIAGSRTHVGPPGRRHSAVAGLCRRWGSGRSDPGAHGAGNVIETARRDCGLSAASGGILRQQSPFPGCCTSLVAELGDCLKLTFGAAASGERMQ